METKFPKKVKGITHSKGHNEKYPNQRKFGNRFNIRFRTIIFPEINLYMQCKDQLKISVSVHVTDFFDNYIKLLLQLEVSLLQPTTLNTRGRAIADQPEDDRCNSVETTKQKNYMEDLSEQKLRRRKNTHIYIFLFIYIMNQLKYSERNYQNICMEKTKLKIVPIVYDCPRDD